MARAFLLPGTSALSIKVTASDGAFDGSSELDTAVLRGSPDDSAPGGCIIVVWPLAISAERRDEHAEQTMWVCASSVPSPPGESVNEHDSVWEVVTPHTLQRTSAMERTR